MSKPSLNNNLYSKIADLLQLAIQKVVRTVNQTMVYIYFEIGRMIVEVEQQGMERAEYGKQVLKKLSQRLLADFGKGFSERNIEQMRQFYLTYSIPQKSSAELQQIKNKKIKIQETTSRISELNPNSEKKSRKFNLSWSHCIKLMRIENINVTLPEDNDQIFASHYQTVLPDKQTFIQLLNESVV